MKTKSKENDNLNFNTRKYNNKFKQKSTLKIKEDNITEIISK